MSTTHLSACVSILSVLLLFVLVEPQTIPVIQDNNDSLIDDFNYGLNDNDEDFILKP
jgi:hypothetical protein